MRAPLLAALALASCGAPPAPAQPDAELRAQSDAEAVTARAACTFKAGALAADTLGPSAPLGEAIPVNTVVILMQENRSFDAYFAHLGRPDVEAATDLVTNPTGAGGSVPYVHAPHLCALDTNHEWTGSHQAYDDGRNDGFYLTNQGWLDGPLPPGGTALLDGARALWWEDERDIPFYYALARTFAIGDHYFSSMMGPTWPNRDFLYAATSFGVIDATVPNLSDAPYPQVDATIFDTLEKAHVTWNIFTDGLPGPTVVVGAGLAARWGRNPVLPMSEFYARAAAGTLPQVAFVEPHLGAPKSTQDDEHPPADLQVGQRFVAQVVLAMFASPQWLHSATFLTYDEAGGLYDHVPPPPACPPDDKAPIRAGSLASYDGFGRYGFRVPFTVVSPYARKAYVSHTVHDHTSILRFLEARFRLPALTRRDANADALLDLFDFAAPPFVLPPALTLPTVDPTELAYCQATFGP
jgi:phospholipase C